MYYTLTGQSGNSYSYHVVLKLYRDCFSSGAQLDDRAPISIFSNANFASVWSGNINRTNIVTLQLGSPSPCISNPPPVCYQVGYYEFDVTLPGTPSGYTITYQRCCRITGINNLFSSSSVGATYTAVIPGTSALATAPANNSAHFSGADTVIVCANNYFCYNFGAKDLDGDVLSYSFCTAYVGGTSGNPAPNPPAAPPYSSVPYSTSYNEGAPLGSKVNLNPATGMMCGVAPAAGIYVVTVCVTESRNGVPIAVQRKDLQIKVGDCNVASSVLKPEYVSCDGFTFNFHNEAPPSPLIHTYYWEFGDGTTSTEATPTHTYADTGVYTFKLVVNRGEGCSDSATSRIKVYPGFFPDFTFTGVCISKPTNFLDQSRTAYGFVNGWQWDFGDLSALNDTSSVKNPSYTYNQTGVKTVSLIVTSNKGCIDTITKDVSIYDKPPMRVAPKDTLICKGDPVQLSGFGEGDFSWTPTTNITNANTPHPTVSPQATTWYVATLNDQGCINRDSVHVRVVDHVTLQARSDTAICVGDSVLLMATTDGLRYSWQPIESVVNPNALTTMALPPATTTYTITAQIGSCTATDDVVVRLVPLPGAEAGPDTMICYNTGVQLHATIKGNAFSWGPAATLDNPNSLNPVASPRTTTRYILTVYDNIGCPKPGRDSVVVTVIPKINADAGEDKAVVVGQRVQFNATGGIGYVWSPGTSLSNTGIPNPVAVYDGSFDSIRYKVVVNNEWGCIDSAFVGVRIFKTDPSIFVPSAFTPNGDGRNDIFRPIAAGMERLEYFRVFNRWGQLVYSTTKTGQGWDGRINGKEQGTGTFVWVVQGIDYTGKSFFAKGTVVLIR